MSEICGTCKYPIEICKCEDDKAWWGDVVVKCDRPDESIKQSKGKTPMGNLLDFPYALEQVSKVREYGLNKYPDNTSYKEIPTEYLLDACMRHLFSKGKDDESGVHHIAHAVVNLLMILEKDRV